MHHAFGMCRFEAAADLPEDAYGLIRRQLAALHQDAFQVATVDVIHGDELAPIRHAQFKNANDVLVRDLPGEYQLLLEAPQDVGMAGKLGPNDFKRNEQIQLAIAGLIHRAHAAFAQTL